MRQKEPTEKVSRAQELRLLLVELYRLSGDKIDQVIEEAQYAVRKEGSPRGAGVFQEMIEGFNGEKKAPEKSGENAPPDKSTNIAKDFRLNLDEERRAEALNEYFAMDAASNPLLQYFRREAFGAVLLTPEQADCFVSTFALTFLSTEEFAKVKDTNLDPVKHPVNTTNVFSSEDYLKRFSYQSPGGEEMTSQWLDGRDCYKSDYLLKMLDNSAKIDWGIYPHSVLGRLDVLSKRLAMLYGWSDIDSRNFVLMGQMPRANSVVAMYHDSPVAILGAPNRYHDREAFTPRAISLSVPYWLPPERVASIFREVQNARLKHLGKASASGRPIGEKRFALFQFVNRRLFSMGILPSVLRIGRVRGKEASGYLPEPT